MKWPGNTKCAVILTFDLDAELMWYNNYPHTPGYISRGQYGVTVGVPRILPLLKKKMIIPRPSLSRARTLKNIRMS